GYASIAVRSCRQHRHGAGLPPRMRPWRIRAHRFRQSKLITIEAAWDWPPQLYQRCRPGCKRSPLFRIIEATLYLQRLTRRHAVVFVQGRWASLSLDTIWYEPKT